MLTPPKANKTSVIVVLASCVATLAYEEWSWWQAGQFDKMLFNFLLVGGVIGLGILIARDANRHLEP